MRSRARSKSVPSNLPSVEHNNPNQFQGPESAAPLPEGPKNHPPNSANLNYSFHNSSQSGSRNPSPVPLSNSHYYIPNSNSISDLEDYYSADKHRNKKPTYMNPMAPKESVAYATTNSIQDRMARFLHFCRQHATAVTLGVAFIVFLVILSEEEMGTSGSSYQGLRKGGLIEHWGGAIHPGYFHPSGAILSPTSYSFATVTDMDELSRVTTEEKPIFRSLMKPGTLNYDGKNYSIELGETRTLISGHNEAGRGMELSELTLYKDRLLAFDDRTGSIFEILTEEPGSSIVVPRFVITEGEGDTDKGMKWEWATVKGDNLVIGSMGKEYTRPDGSIKNTNNLWIATVSPKGEVNRIDWKQQYGYVRGLLGAEAPGYVIHEAVLWSEQTKSWIFIPRRVSSEKYNDVVDERKGTNKFVVVNESFTKGEVLDIKFPEGFDTLHGFSTAAFVPGTKERHIAALRSVEEDCVGGDASVCKQRTYMVVFDVKNGDVLMEETDFDPTFKFEGLEFLNIDAVAKIA